MDFAKRASDHLHYDIDPIVRSRMDTDFYKILMRQVIASRHPLAQVRIALKNRTSDVRLADFVPIEAMRAQLDHAQKLRYKPNELIWLKGNSFYGEDDIFKPGFIETLGRSQLPDYELTIDEESGQFVFETEGNWGDVSDWEIHALSIVNEMRNRAVMAAMAPYELDIMYARAKAKLAAKLERLKEHPEITISDFGTRRRHGFLWQRWCIDLVADMLGKQYVGTSNAYMAMETGCDAKGTNAHELAMVYAALAAATGDDEKADQAIRDSQYVVLKDWQNEYHDRLRVMLPDAYGTSQFLENAPNWVQWWTGARPDSKEPVEAGEELIAFWKSVGQDPTKKLTIFSDGMDVRIPGYEPNGTDIIEVHEHFKGRTIDTYGWGTSLTNDFRGTTMGNGDLLKPLSLVCKVHSVNGHPAVKLSDNPSKASSPSAAEIERYKRVFGVAGIGEARATLV